MCVGWGASAAAAIALVKTSGAAAGEVDLGKGVAVPLWGGHGGDPTRAPKLKPPLFALGRSRSEYTAAAPSSASAPPSCSALIEKPFALTSSDGMACCSES